MADTSPTEALPYALVRDAEWRLHEAIDLRGDEPIATVARPFIDWYAEYQRSVSENGSTVVGTVELTGHREAFGDVQSALEKLGVTFRSEHAGTQAVLIGHTDRSPIVLIDGNPVLMLVGTAEVSEPDLLAVAATVERVDVEAWTSAGGRIA